MTHPAVGLNFTHAANFKRLSLALFLTMTERNSKRLEFVLNVLVGQEVDVTVRSFAGRLVPWSSSQVFDRLECLLARLSDAAHVCLSWPRFFLCR